MSGLSSRSVFSRRYRPKHRSTLVAKSSFMDTTLGGDHALGMMHNSHLGQKWCEYWEVRGRSGHDQDLVPKVDVAFKICRLSDIDEKRGTFDVDFVLLLDWIDPSLEREKHVELEKKWMEQERMSGPGIEAVHDFSASDDAEESIDFYNHFIPVVEVQYVKDGLRQVGGGEANPRPRLRPPNKLTGECNHVTMTVRYQFQSMARFNFRNFPFERQILPIGIKTQPISDGVSWTSGDHHGYVELRHPTRWRYKRGHVVDFYSDWLADWDILEIGCGPRSYHRTKFRIQNADGSMRAAYEDRPAMDGYDVQVIIQRDPSSIIWNHVFSLVVVDVLALVAYGIEPLDFQDRASVVLTMLLTAMAFKFTLSSSLPAVPYLTLMDKQMIMSLLLLMVQGLVMWLIAELEFFLCYYDGMTFWTREVHSSGRNATHGVWKGREYPYNPTPDSCLWIHRWDRVMMFLQMTLVIVKSLSFFVMRHLSKAKTWSPIHIPHGGGLIDMDSGAIGAITKEYHLAKDVSRPFDKIHVPPQVDALPPLPAEAAAMPPSPPAENFSAGRKTLTPIRRRSSPASAGKSVKFSSSAIAPTTTRPSGGAKRQEDGDASAAAAAAAAAIVARSSAGEGGIEMKASSIGSGAASSGLPIKIKQQNRVTMAQGPGVDGGMEMKFGSIGSGAASSGLSIKENRTLRTVTHAQGFGR